VIEHDCVIGDFAHISPSAALAGNVKVGEETHIGIGSSIRNNISVCADVTVGAGAAVVKDITEKGTYVGVPARRIK
jgi:UDP-3-O-[3-hydroxymyristoyl] glucosamine N-acyltransferase